ncbi:DsbA family oxidoreductase [Pseudooceanicola nitratireducens]|uniref:DsbA family oxidoreductase n=1 Tax=Pseudooceanicola nitratireducens TaxID=517719 RepID=UPI00310A79F1
MTDPIRVDIVSDVVCPWCAIGYSQLRQASDQTGIAIEVHWHPFELNPDMGPEGENLRDHVKRKYGSSAADSAAARDRITAIGKEIGFDFAFAEDQRMWNTFRAHQLIDWAEGQGRAHDMKLALLTAYFTQGRNVDDLDVLVDVADGIGLDADQARQALDSGSQADQVRGKQRFWTQQGITGVPAMVFLRQHLVTGAQGTENYARILQHLAAEAA